MKKITQQGFTLIELLVVVAIIGVLATLFILNLQTTRAKARDARRISDIKQIQSLLAQYKDTYGSFPLSPLNATGTTRIWSTTILFSSDPTPPQVPVAPEPPDGDCIGRENTYSYRSIDGRTYGLTYCIGRDYAQYHAGYSFAYKERNTLRYDLNGDGVLTIPPVVPPATTTDSDIIGSCEAHTINCDPLPVELLDINNSGATNSYDGGCLINIITKFLQGLHPDPSIPGTCVAPPA